MIELVWLIYVMEFWGNFRSSLKLWNLLQWCRLLSGLRGFSCIWRSVDEHFLGCHCHRQKREGDRVHVPKKEGSYVTREDQKSPKVARLPGLHRKHFIFANRLKVQVWMSRVTKAQLYTNQHPAEFTAQKRKMTWKRSPNVVCNYWLVSGTGGEAGWSPLGSVSLRTCVLFRPGKTLSILLEEYIDSHNR